MSIKRLLTLLALVLSVSLFVGGCSGGEISFERACRVVEYRVPEATPICAVECSYWKGYMGFATATQVSCEWSGKEVTWTPRDRRE